MANQYKQKPVWKELKLYTATADELEDLCYKYELLLDPRKFAIFFFGTTTTLNAQEYNFLKAILTKRGKRISANKLMTEIKSNCKPELKQTLSYRIKSKIKTKLKKVTVNHIPLEGNEWILLDRKANHPANIVYNFNGEALHHQYFDFERYFNILISVKDGYYYTEFMPA